MLSLLVSIIFAFPAGHALRGPAYLAVNTTTKQCLQYWPGERHSLSVLPKGWQRWMAVDLVETPLGSCQFQGKPEDAKKCCESLGLSYVPAKDIMKVLRPEDP